MKSLLEAGVHFGHETKRWNPKMKKYIFGEKNKIYIIDLEKTQTALLKACDFLSKIASEGGSILFVGTKKQAQEIVKEEALRCGMFYVNQRWLGGMLTNFQTIKKSIKRLEDIESMREDGRFDKISKKEASQLNKEAFKLNKNLEGIRAMGKPPKAMFIIDSKKEDIAVKEARNMHIPIVALVDTNCDPDVIDYPIPGNDDAIRSIKLMMSIIADSVLKGRQALAAGKAKQEEEQRQEASGGDEIKIIDEEVEELVPGDLKLKEDEARPKDEPIKKGPKLKKTNN
ncbi:MAG: 30S ribosomal protein S2 [Candidatus Omnitrophota bacterium]|nr:30S ribosomal protein S2 [Candidatus Omnitrophota bacterium]